ncbi:hypothetical protein EV356DRAFT_436707, partial [Viridothelium virens]
NPLLGLSVKGTRLLLTLHVLFPHELLPALDLLERGCVLRTVVKPRAAILPNQNLGPDTLSLLIQSEQNDKQITAYYVQHYEVRLHAWHCSCPAFAFAAFPASMWLNVEGPMDDARKAEATKAWRFGGLGVRGQVPVCKHLLACLLGQQCLLLQDFVREKELSVEEAAGWAAGLG